jgi:hypothetical protein
VPPHFYNGNVEGIRDTGSDTTFFMMQRLGDLYTSAGLFGCTLNGAAGNPLYNTSDQATLTVVATTNAAINSGTATTSIPVNATTVVIPVGAIIVLEGTPNQQVTVATAAPIGSTSISVNSFTPTTTYASGTTVGEPEGTTANENFFCQAGQNVSTTDVNDNWDRTELTQGVDSVGSGAGQNQLCGAAPTPLNVDFSRSSKPAGTACGDMVQTGYAKDGVDALFYPVNPTQIGTGVAATAPYTTLNGGVVGPVGNGWQPGDANLGPFSGTALTTTGLTNVGNAASNSYELWCASDATRITDWGQLTNLGPAIVVPNASVTSGSPTVTLAAAPFASIAANQAITGPDIPAGTTVLSVTTVAPFTITMSANASSTNANENPKVTLPAALAVGAGAPNGIPVRIMGVNGASGTEATWASYANSGVGATGNCSANMNTNAATDPNPVTATGGNAGKHIALENNSDQVNQFAVGDFPGDLAAQAIEAATTLYIESDGVYNTDTFAGATTINGVSFSGVKVPLNGRSPTTATKIANTYPTARTLFNIYRTGTIRASVGGFLNWTCDANVNFIKGIDNSTGLNFDTELTNAIGSVFGFPRLQDTSPAPAIGTPADGQAAPNNTCAASLAVNTTAGSTAITLASGASFPVDIPNASGLANGTSVTVTGTGIPAGTTVSSGSGTTTLTLSAAATATSAAGGVSVVFGGVPSVTAVNSPQT